MKTSIAIINSSIAMKAGNGINGFNFYQWLKDARSRFRNDLTLAQTWMNICYANCTEKSCKQRFSTEGYSNFYDKPFSKTN